METYCQNPLCQNEAIVEVPVSVERPGDQVTALCAVCEEAYTWGVQHATMCTSTRSQSRGTNVSAEEQQG
jgi:hypothetical protein